jgi:hypothetical protein
MTMTARDTVQVTARDSMQVSVILLFIAAGFIFHFAFNDGVQTESSTPATASAPTISKKLERARALQQAAVRLNQQRFVALKERKAQRARVARARARAARAFAAAGVSRSRSSALARTRSASPVSSAPPQPARSAPVRSSPSPSPKPAPSGGGGGKGSFDDSG